ncbi:MAG: DapH/DapD/GlmU-related protein [Halioglobus sp.]
MKIYVALCDALAKMRSKILVIDLRLRGANVHRTVKMKARIDINNAESLVLAEGVQIGRGVKVTISGSKVAIGAGTVLGDNARLDAIGGDISIGSNVLINTSTIVTSWSGVVVGDNVLFAPFCHITDRNHGLERAELIRSQRGTSAPIEIGEDVWVASSCMILEGVSIARGAVVGANSVVNKSVDEYTIVAGTPAKVIGNR